jgi:pimeloyl-ACP methyl ester carboxylesterase
MEYAISADGTRIAYDRRGSGPAVVLIGGGPTDRQSEAPLAELLAPDFTVYNFDRRGRGDSEDPQPYVSEREFDDIAAVIAAAGGSAMAFGTSGGALVALLAAARGLPITRLALWEPPYILDGARLPLPADYRDRMWELREQGRGGDMLAFFLIDGVGMPAEMVAGMQAAPFWEQMGAGASCLAYDAELLGDLSMPRDLLKAVGVPALVIDGGVTPWITAACDETAAVIQDAQRTTIAGQPHNVDAAALAPVVAGFLRGARA